MKKISLFFLIISGSLLAQTFGSYGFSTSKNASLAFTYTSNSLGTDAIGVNPANLALNDRTSFSLRTIFPLPPINFATTTPLSVEKYNYFFGGVTDAQGNRVGRYLTQSDKDELNELLGEYDFILNFQLNYLSFAINVNEKVGGFGFAFTDRFGASLRLSKIFTDLIFSGLYPMKLYSLSDLDAKVTFLREISFSYGRKILDFDYAFVKNIYGGIALKFVRGYYYLSTSKNNSFFRYDSDNVIRGAWDFEIQHALTPDIAKNYGKDSIISVKDFSFTLFPEPAGTGLGFDIGVTSFINDQLRVSLAVTDIGSITWDRNQAIIKGNGNFTFEGYSSEEQLDSLVDKFKNVQSNLNTSFSSGLPTTLRLGLSYQLDQAPFISRFPGKMLISLDYNQGLNSEIGNSTKPRVSLGIDWDPAKRIPNIRTGFSVGGKLGFMWGFGLGMSLGPIEFNFATSNFDALVSPNTSKKINLYVDSKWRF